MADDSDIVVPVSVGEVVDKLTILEIKSERIDDPERRRNVETELAALRDVFVARHPSPPVEVEELIAALRKVNEALWVIEDDIRDCERRQDFGPSFVELARSVYIRNDERASIKRQINVALGSRLIEEKSYQPYR